MQGRIALSAARNLLRVLARRPVRGRKYPTWTVPFEVAAETTRQYFTIDYLVGIMVIREGLSEIREAVVAERIDADTARRMLELIDERMDVRTIVAALRRRRAGQGPPRASLRRRSRRGLPACTRRP